MSEAEQKSPVWVHCTLCSHEWVIFYAPISWTIAEEFLRNFYCPKCHAHKNIIMGRKKQDSVQIDTMSAQALDSSAGLPHGVTADDLEPLTPYEEMSREELIECCKAHDAHHQEHHKWQEGLEYKLQAALQSPARPVIKPLVWARTHEQGGIDYVAVTPFHTYRVYRDAEGSNLWCIDGVIQGECYNELQAKAWAEAHWQAKIGECLTESIQPETLHNPASDKQALHKIEDLRLVENYLETALSYIDNMADCSDKKSAVMFCEKSQKLVGNYVDAAQLAAQEGGEG